MNSKRTNHLNKIYLNTISTFFLITLVAMFASNLSYHQKWGMNIILQIQPYRTSFLDVFMKTCSLFGFETFFILIPAVVWSGRVKDCKRGLQLITILQMSQVISSLIKMFFLEDRPIWLNKEAIASVQTTTSYSNGNLEYSFPSGHAWGTTTCYVYLAYFYGTAKDKKTRWWFLIVCVTIVLLTSFSRVYFGLHYPHDIIAGIACGLLVFLKSDYFTLYEYREDASNEISNKRISDSPLFPVTILALTFATSYMITMSFFEHEQRKMQIGLFYSFGSLAGIVFMRPFVIFLEADQGWKFFLRIIIGTLPLFAIFPYIIYIAFSWNQLLLEVILFLIGFSVFSWIQTFAPLLFIKIGLGHSVLNYQNKSK